MVFLVIFFYWTTLGYEKTLSIYTLLDKQMEGKGGEGKEEEEIVAVCVKYGEGAKEKMGGGGGMKASLTVMRASRRVA